MTRRCDSHRPRRFKLPEPSADSSKCETPRSLRSSINAKNFTGKCFLCHRTSEDDVLHQFQTLYMDVHVTKVAGELGDTNLFTKLSEEDMVAFEAVYHLNCPKKLCNRYSHP